MLREETRPFRWRSIAVPAFGPTLLFTIGEGAILPLIPALALGVGADLAGASVVAAMLLVGVLIGDVPAGFTVGRIGERTAMLGASALAAAGIGLALIATTPLLLGLGMTVLGIAAAVFGLARHALLTSVVPVAYRARALSTLGGIFRLGLFIGPFAAAALVAATGAVTSILWFALLMCGLVALSIVALPDPERILHHRSTPVGGALTPAGVFRTIAERRDVLARLGAAALVVSALRAVRQVILPLWAVSIGLGEAETALII
ncbi:MFS transporter [Microcella putealis]|uniref:MFS transporter n=1 Tax=Microcella putealis TaxID=337005 RepID=UPI001F54120E|nr:MFS transporter [Microcella putealis]